jgi:hypothetical protein
LRTWTDSDDEQDAHEADGGDDGTLEPGLAVLDVEASLCEITHEVWLARELLADRRANDGAEGGECKADGGQCAEAEVGDGIVAVKTDV